MARTNKGSAADYSNQFKPAIQLGAPTLDQWSNNFYALARQDKVDASGEHMLRLGRGLSDDPSFNNVIQLRTPVSGFAPNFRQVEVTGKKGYAAYCVEGGSDQLGVFVYLLRTVAAGGGLSETQINLRYLPYAMLSDLVQPSPKGGMMEIKLPEVDIAKLNVTLCASPLKEPEFRTFKTEVVFENLPLGVQQDIENRLNFQAAQIAGFVGYQALLEQGQWPPAVSATAGVGAVEISQQTKALAVAVIVTIGAVLNVVNNAVQGNGLGGVGAGLAGAGAMLGAWMRYADLRAQAVPVVLPIQQPPQQPPQRQGEDMV